MNTRYLISFIDMLFAMLLGLLSIFILSFMLINPKATSQSKLDSRAQLQILMTWDDHSPNDIDLWVLTPEGEHIGFSNRENTYMSLDRDDVGQKNDFTIVNGQKVPIYINREVISLRTRHPGRYTVNAYYFAQHPDIVTKQFKKEPEEVKIELDNISPSYQILQTASFNLNEPENEATAFSFTIEEDGTVDQFSTISKPFVRVATQVEAAEAEEGL